MSLYLKYRPQTFEDLVGQDFISTTLKNAIKEDKLVGAYLFTGPRGTGKTSSARIFARSINCLNQKEGSPCLDCEICNAFSQNQLMDIIEIDAASYTGVDNIRDIIEKAQFTPNRAKYKVYIIDEVHMLSKGAFNALLKILEEPPSHVKFILATTEINKVLDTILSRCQRYDFKSIDDDTIKKRLTFIAQKEQIQIDEKSLNYITKNAFGALRNAINLFEQLVIDYHIHFDELIKNLGVTEDDSLTIFLKKLEKNDKTILEDFELLTRSGKNLKLFFKDLLYFAKERIIERLGRNEDYKTLLHILGVLDDAYTKSKHSLDEKITFFTVLLKLLSESHGSGNNNLSEEVWEFQKSTKAEEKKNDSKPIGAKKLVSEESSISISTDIVEDIFRTEELNVDKNIKQESISLDIKEDFIKELKTLGVKGGIIMGVKGATIARRGDTFVLYCPSTVAYKSMNTEDAYNALLQGLQNIGMHGIDIKIECQTQKR